MKFNHRKEIQIRFGDIDILGHVNNAVQLSYFDLARLSYFEQFYGDIIRWEESAVIVAHLEIDFLVPILIKDNIEVLTRITRIGNKSLGIEQQIVDINTREVKTRSTQVMVGYNQRLSTSIPIPEELKSRIMTFENELV